MQTFLVKARLNIQQQSLNEASSFLPIKTSAYFIPEPQRANLLHSRSQGQSVIQPMESEEKARYPESVCPQSQIRRHYYCSCVQEDKPKHKNY